MSLLKIMFCSQCKEQYEPDGSELTQSSTGRMKGYISEFHIPSAVGVVFNGITVLVQFKLGKVLLFLGLRRFLCHSFLAQDKIFDDQSIHVRGQKTAICVFE